jgi:hypothetical protein
MSVMVGPVVEEFRPVLKNSLRGFARVRFASGLVVHEVTLHVSEGRAWASPPARQMTARDGTLLVDDAGKVRWQPLVSFASKAVRDRWSQQVVEAVRETCPDWERAAA